MNVTVVLILALAAVLAYVFRAEIKDGFLKLVALKGSQSPVPPVQASKGQDPAPQSPAAQAPVGKPATGSDNPWLDAYKQSGGNASLVKPDTGPVAPAVDTSGAILDFNVVGNGVPINLNVPKTIVNCPANVLVQTNQASGQSGATNTYTLTVNGKDFTCPNVQATCSAPAQGPTVTVSVSCPGLQMEIRGN